MMQRQRQRQRKQCMLAILSTIAVSSTRTSSYTCSAWTFVPQQHSHPYSYTAGASVNVHSLAASRSRSSSTILRMSDQWDDEEQTPLVTSYDDAASSLMKRKEEADMEGMSDEAVPGSETENQEVLRNAIRARTQNLGMDEASQDAMKNLEARAAKRAGSGGLDLSQVTDGFEKLSINYDPEDEMTEAEMRAADPLGFEPPTDQYMFELKETTFPGPVATISKVGVLILLGVATGGIIITTDRVVRDLYVDQGLLPSKDDIARAQNSGMEMAQELTKTTVSPGAMGSGGGGLPDLSP